MEWVRVRMMQEASVKLDNQLREKLFFAVFAGKKDNFNQGGIRIFDDLRVLRDVLPCPALSAVIDVPFSLITLALLFLIHPTVGWFSVFVVLIQVFMAWFNQRDMSEPLQKANGHNNMAQQYAQGAVRNSQVVESMGMLKGLETRWLKHQQSALAEQAKSSDVAGIFTVLSKLLQNLQGSLVLGMGCWLTLEGSIAADGGLIIGGSILAGRALVPFVTIITQWRQLSNAMMAASRLNELLTTLPEEKKAMKLPAPLGNLKLEGVYVTLPKRDAPILAGVNLMVNPGQILALVGPSASGKTTLARVIVGAWPVTTGKVRLDDSDIANWNKQELGPYIGYLSQNIELFDGSIAENIARFGEVEIDAVIQASEWVGLDHIISNLPNGYETQVGFDGAFLSGGMRQRIGLARAIYKLPKLVVLDEPNSSLDEAGETALLATLTFLKQAGCAVVIVSHRMNILSAVDGMLVLVEGQVKAYGPRDEVLASLNAANKPTLQTNAIGVQG
jgi:ATP-binding cassette subfamily C exporter for protease/lipase